MIRINLLAVEREKPRKRGRRRPRQSARRSRWSCSLILVVTALGIGLVVVGARPGVSAARRRTCSPPQREMTHLQTILAQVDTFDKQKQQLQQRVALIEELRKGQSGRRFTSSTK